MAEAAQKKSTFTWGKRMLFVKDRRGLNSRVLQCHRPDSILDQPQLLSSKNRTEPLVSQFRVCLCQTTTIVGGCCKTPRSPLQLVLPWDEKASLGRSRSNVGIAHWAFCTNHRNGPFGWDFLAIRIRNTKSCEGNLGNKTHTCHILALVPTCYLTPLAGTASPKPGWVIFKAASVIEQKQLICVALTKLFEASVVCMHLLFSGASSMHKWSALYHQNTGGN